MSQNQKKPLSGSSGVSTGGTGSVLPPPLGAYEPARKAGPFLFISGQIPLDPDTGTLVSGDIGLQTKKVMKNIKIILDTYKINFNHIIKTGIFLKRAEDFTRMNEVYRSYFKAPFPARFCVIVKDLPKGADMEIEALAYFGPARQGQVENQV